MFDSWRSRSFLKTAVCVHISYPNFAIGILKKLETIRAPFTLIVSHSGHLPESLCQILDKIRANRVVEIYQEPKLGFDILPFLYLLPRLLNFDIVCKLHTVRNFAEVGKGRRDPPVEILIGSDTAFREIVGYFGQERRIGMLGPADLYLSSYSPPEKDDMHALLAEFSPNEIGHEWGFFAGSMFWARTEMLLPIANMAVDIEAAFYHEKRDISQAVEPIFGLLPALQKREVGVLVLTSDGLKIRKFDGMGEHTRDPSPFHLKLYNREARDLDEKCIQASRSSKSELAG